MPSASDPLPATRDPRARIAALALLAVALLALLATAATAAALQDLLRRGETTAAEIAGVEDISGDETGPAYVPRLWFVPDGAADGATVTFTADGPTTSRRGDLAIGARRRIVYDPNDPAGSARLLDRGSFVAPVFLLLGVSLATGMGGIWILAVHGFLRIHVQPGVAG